MILQEFIIDMFDRDIESDIIAVYIYRCMSRPAGSQPNILKKIPAQLAAYDGGIVVFPVQIQFVHPIELASRYKCIERQFEGLLL